MLLRKLCFYNTQKTSKIVKNAVLAQNGQKRQKRVKNGQKWPKMAGFRKIEHPHALEPKIGVFGTFFPIWSPFKILAKRQNRPKIALFGPPGAGFWGVPKIAKNEHFLSVFTFATLIITLL